jgi:hypothetical protein
MAEGFYESGTYHIVVCAPPLVQCVEPTSADAMVVTSYLSFGKVPEWKAVEIRYTRTGK